MKVRKKPVEVEAITFQELVDHGIMWGANLIGGVPWSFDYKGHPITHENDDCYLIPTLEGTMKFNRGELLVTGVKGEIYPIKRDIFDETYQEVGEPDAYVKDLAKDCAEAIASDKVCFTVLEGGEKCTNIDAMTRWITKTINIYAEKHETPYEVVEILLAASKNKAQQADIIQSVRTVGFLTEEQVLKLIQTSELSDKSPPKKPTYRLVDGHIEVDGDANTYEVAEVGIDGDCGYALLGPNLQEGEAEFVQIPEPNHVDDRRAQKMWACQEAMWRLRKRLELPNLTYHMSSSHPNYR